jgi:hypothetical protein
VAPAPVKAQAPKVEEAPIAPAPDATQTPITPATGRVLHRIRGFMNCVERMRREDALLGAFLSEGRAFTTDEGRIIIQHDNDWALDMLQAASAKQMLARVFSAELKHPVDVQSLVFEVKSAKASESDTILDDLIEAAEQQ